MSRAAPFEHGEAVIVTAPRSRPNCLVVEPRTYDIRHGVYLGIPRFEYTIAQVRIGGQVWRFPLEYLSRAETAP